MNKEKFMNPFRQYEGAFTAFDSTRETLYQANISLVNLKGKSGNELNRLYVTEAGEGAAADEEKS